MEGVVENRLLLDQFIKQQSSDVMVFHFKKSLSNC